MYVYLLFLYISTTVGGITTSTTPATTIVQRPQKVYRIIPTNEHELRLLFKLQESVITSSVDGDVLIDFWKEPTTVGAPVDIFVKDDVIFADNELHFEYMRVMIDDVDQLILNQFDRSNKDDVDNYHDVETFITSSSQAFYCLDTYQSYDNVVLYLRSLVTQYPTLSKLITIGKSLEGRDIYGVQISVPEDNTNNTALAKRGIYIDSTIHAREWISTAVNLNILLNFLRGYEDKDPQVLDLLQVFEVTIVPVLNVDGYVYTWTTNRMWRKTRRPNQGGSFGVDMNRNADVEWCQRGATTVPSSETYCGPYPLSEPELVATFDYIASLQNVLVYWNLHSYGQEIIIPYAYDNSILTPDRSYHLQAGDLFWEGINKETGLSYDGPRPPNGVYSGFAMDSIYINLNVKYSGLIELRDTGRFGFLLPETQICDCSREIWGGVKLHAGFAIRNA